MGLAASQARLLTITSRLSSNELKQQQIANTKMRLANDSDTISSEYSRALNNQTLKFDDVPMTYDALAAAGYEVKNADGTTTMASYETRRKYPDAPDPGPAPSKTDSKYNTKKTYNVSIQWDGVTYNGQKILLKNNSANIDGESVSFETQLQQLKVTKSNTDNAEKVKPSITTAKSSAYTASRANDTHLVLDESRELTDPNLSVNDPFGDSGNNGLTKKPYLNEIKQAQVKEISGHEEPLYTVAEARTNMGTALDDMNTASSALNNNGYSSYASQLNNLYSSYNSLRSSGSKSAIAEAGTAMYNKLNSILTAIGNETKTITEWDKTKTISYSFTRTTFNEAAYNADLAEWQEKYNMFTATETVNTSSGTQEEFINNLKNNPQFLIQGLLSGYLELWKDGQQVSLSSDTRILTEYDKSDDAQAEAKYNAEMAKINRKEKMLDMQMKQLDTEYQALSSELESVKSIISNHASKDFELFS